MKLLYIIKKKGEIRTGIFLVCSDTIGHLRIQAILNEEPVLL
jgi:hypothetical protein